MLITGCFVYVTSVMSVRSIKSDCVVVVRGWLLVSRLKKQPAKLTSLLYFIVIFRRQGFPLASATRTSILFELWCGLFPQLKILLLTELWCCDSVIAI